METKQEHYESMMQAIARYAPSADLEVIQRAYAYADEKHKNQLRKSGEPYIIHPLAVAEIVAEIGLDTDAIAAALLHDCLEDTDASFEEISRLFGETVANLVEGVTKLTRVQYSTMEEQQMENLRKMFMAMSKDIRVILIKISDRLHNTRTLQYQTPAKQISAVQTPMPFRLLNARIAASLLICATASRSNAPVWTRSAKSVIYAALRNVMPSACRLGTPAARMASALTVPSASCTRCQIVACAFVEICWPMMWCTTDENRSGSTVRSICPMRSITSQSRLSFLRR